MSYSVPMGITRVIHSGPALDLPAIGEMEARLGVALPEPYREFLLRHNGGKPEPANYRNRKLRLFHIVDDRFEEYANLWGDIDNMRDDLPEDVIPVAYDDSGDRVCLALAGENRGRVYLWDSEGREPAFDYRTEFPGLDLPDNYEFKPDDWPGHPDLTLIAEDFAEFLESFHEWSEEAKFEAEANNAGGI